MKVEADSPEVKSELFDYSVDIKTEQFEDYSSLNKEISEIYPLASYGKSEVEGGTTSDHINIGGTQCVDYNNLVVLRVAKCWQCDPSSFSKNYLEKQLENYPDKNSTIVILVQN